MRNLRTALALAAFPAPFAGAYGAEDLGGAIVDAIASAPKPQPLRGSLLSASASRICADPGRSGFGWLSAGAQPVNQIVSKVARSRPSRSAKRSA